MFWVFTEVMTQDDTVTFVLNCASISALFPITIFVRVNQCNGQDFH